MFGLVTEADTDAISGNSDKIFFKSTVTEKKFESGNFNESVGKQQTNNFLWMASAINILA